MTNGIDVSTVQGRIDWKRVRAAKVDFAMIKATQGRGEGASTKNLRNFADSRFAENIIGASAAGIACGVYHYFTAKTVDEVDREAAFFLKTIAPYKSKITLWAAVDVESEPHLKGIDRTPLTALVRRFMRKITAAGYKPMLYANPNFLTYRFEPGAFDDVPLWLAYWGRSTPYPGTDPLIWQFGAGTIDGIDGDVDHNHGYFDIERPEYKVGGKYTIREGDVYTNGKPVPERLIGQEYTIQQAQDDRILLREILSWVKI